ncbi:MAG: hypothetical protein HZC45_03230 [Deltaproteobacteria bacterium]|nr:hypothetical protein [Deltaproteobacteria bacterium]
MMKYTYVIAAFILALIGSVLLASGGIKEKTLMLIKSRGYLEYTPIEAQELAYTRCKQCHPIDKVTKYCMRCGPPFIIVLHNMKKLIALEKQKQAMQWISSITDAEAVAITQVWNALVGNWEDTWRKEDLKKLLEKDDTLIRLLDTPVKERKIEAGLKGKTAGGVYKETYDTMKPLPNVK